MNILLGALLAASLVGNVFLIVVCVRFSRRLLQFDDLFQLLVDDIDVNLKYFSKLLTTPLFENSNEIKAANKNMGIISKRLDEFVNRMEETSNKRLRKMEPAPNPPVVR